MKTHTPGPVCAGCDKKLSDAHPKLAAWYREKKKKYENLHVAWSFRNMKEQMAAFNQRPRVTNLPWPLSKHNHMEDAKPCALALDLFLIGEDGEAAWPRAFYVKLAHEIKEGKEPIRWGGYFRKGTDLKPTDAPHFELVL